MKKIIETLFLVPITCFLNVSPAAADQMNQYDIKVLCGPGTPQMVKTGRYFTTVNVRNPTHKDIFAILRFVRAGELVDGRVFRENQHAFGNENTQYFDCKEFFSMAGTTAASGFLDGHFVIESIEELVIDVVHSADFGNDKGDFEVTRQEPYKVTTPHSLACGSNLDINLNATNLWSLANGNPAVAATGSHPTWDQNGAWTSTFSDGIVVQNQSNTFQIDFCTCNNSTTNVEIFRFGADFDAALTLDSMSIANPIGTISAPATTISAHTSSPGSNQERKLMLTLINNADNGSDPNNNVYGFNIGGRLTANNAYLGQCRSVWPE